LPASSFKVVFAKQDVRGCGYLPPNIHRHRLGLRTDITLIPRM
jgi:hypothetical protein